MAAGSEQKKDHFESADQAEFEISSDKKYDRDMREPLFDFLDEQFGKIRVIEEKIIRGSRADVLGVLDGYIVGFEIKSDHDTYVRLRTQVKDYDRFCDFCYVVVGASHRKRVAEHVPEHWGIIAVTDEGVFLDRGADDNPSAKLSEQILLMWKRELFMLLDLNGCPKYRSKSREFLRNYLLTHISPKKLKKQMTDLIFERDYTQFDDQAPAGKSSPPKKKVRSIRKTLKETAHTAHFIGKKKSGKKTGKKTGTKNSGKKGVSRKNT